MSTFHLFLYLPPELRAVIWELSIDAREVIFKQRLVDPANAEHDIYFPSPTLTLSSLQVCRESRSHLSSRFCTRAFGNGTLPHYVWVNFAVDTIRIGEIGLPSLFNLTSHLAIRSLTVDCPAQSTGVDPDFEEYKKCLRSMPALERLSIVCDMPRASRGMTNRSYEWECLIIGLEAPVSPEGHHSSLHCTMRYTDTGDMTRRELSIQRLKDLAAIINQEALHTCWCGSSTGAESGDLGLVRNNHAKLLRAARMG